MKHSLHLAALAFLALAAPGYAQTPAPAASAAPARAPAAPAAPAPTLHFLMPGDIDPALLLPPPIADGSPTQLGEVAEVLQLQKNASSARWDQAVWDDRHESAELFTPTLGPSFNLAALPATAKAMASVQNERDVATNTAKVFFDRARPWTFNADIKVCEAAGRDGAQRRSYPSAHATLSFAEGVVLANLMPDKGAIIMARAADFAMSRVICGVHYKSDIVASQALGTSIGVLLLHNAAFKPQLEAARSELRAAGLTAK
jgi:acid phosphatase (class A)